MPSPDRAAARAARSRCPVRLDVRGASGALGPALLLAARLDPRRARPATAWPASSAQPGAAAARPADGRARRRPPAGSAGTAPTRRAGPVSGAGRTPSTMSATSSARAAAASLGRADRQVHVGPGHPPGEGRHQRAGHVLGAGRRRQHPQPAGRGRLRHLAPGAVGQPDEFARPGRPARGRRGSARCPLPLRRNSGSPRSARSAATAAETAGSLTPSAAAAARNEPSSATSANVLSWVNVMGSTLITGRLSRC